MKVNIKGVLFYLKSIFDIFFFSKWPTTLHCDLGCDNYDSVPWEQGQQNMSVYYIFRLIKFELQLSNIFFLVKQSCQHSAV